MRAASSCARRRCTLYSALSGSACTALVNCATAASQSATRTASCPCLKAREAAHPVDARSVTKRRSETLRLIFFWYPSSFGRVLLRACASCVLLPSSCFLFRRPSSSSVVLLPAACRLLPCLFLLAAAAHRNRLPPGAVRVLHHH